MVGKTKLNQNTSLWNMGSYALARLVRPIRVIEAYGLVLTKDFKVCAFEVLGCLFSLSVTFLFCLSPWFHNLSYPYPLIFITLLLMSFIGIVFSLKAWKSARRIYTNEFNQVMEKQDLLEERMRMGRVIPKATHEKNLRSRL